MTASLTLWYIPVQEEVKAHTGSAQLDTGESHGFWEPWEARSRSSLLDNRDSRFQPFVTMWF